MVRHIVTVSQLKRFFIDKEVQNMWLNFYDNLSFEYVIKDMKKRRDEYEKLSAMKLKHLIFIGIVDSLTN